MLSTETNDQTNRNYRCIAGMTQTILPSEFPPHLTNQVTQTVKTYPVANSIKTTMQPFVTNDNDANIELSDTLVRNILLYIVKQYY